MFQVLLAMLLKSVCSGQFMNRNNINYENACSGKRMVLNGNEWVSYGIVKRWPKQRTVKNGKVLVSNFLQTKTYKLSFEASFRPDSRTTWRSIIQGSVFVRFVSPPPNTSRVANHPHVSTFAVRHLNP